jgi:hypothetical protein
MILHEWPTPAPIPEAEADLAALARWLGGLIIPPPALTAEAVARAGVLPALHPLEHGRIVRALDALAAAGTLLRVDVTRRQDGAPLPARFLVNPKATAAPVLPAASDRPVRLAEWPMVAGGLAWIARAAGQETMSPNGFAIWSDPARSWVAIVDIADEPAP